MANARIAHLDLDGSTDTFDVTFDYIAKSHVIVKIDGVATTAFTWLTDSRIQMDSMPASGSNLIIVRETSPTTRLVDYQTGSILSETVLDTDSLQAFYLTQEAKDVTESTLSVSDTDNQWDGTSKRITNVTDPTSAQDAVTKNYLESTWLSSADKETLTDATSFAKVYIGSSASNPTQRSDGTALQAGDLYFNTSTDAMRVYDGAAWGDVALSASAVVGKTSSTGSAEIPVGTTAQRDGSPSTGFFRYNTTESQFEGYDGSAWGQIGGGAGYFKGENGTVGSSAGDIFRVNEQELNTNTTIASTENASATGPLSIASGVTLTVDGNLTII